MKKLSQLFLRFFPPSDTLNGDWVFAKVEPRRGQEVNLTNLVNDTNIIVTCALRF